MKNTIWLIIILLLNTLIHMVVGSSSIENMQSLSPMPFVSNDKELDIVENKHRTCKSKYTDVVWYVPNRESNVSQLIYPNESLIFFKSTEYRPKCCAHTCDMKYKYAFSANPLDERIGKTNGCPCLSNEQITYLQKRGGNHNDAHDNTMT